MALARAGKVKWQTPVQEKDTTRPKQKVGRAKKRYQAKKQNSKDEEQKQLENLQLKLEARLLNQDQPRLEECVWETNDNKGLFPVNYYDKSPDICFSKKELIQILKVFPWLLKKLERKYFTFKR
jgi:hypothetical protein